MLASTPTPTKQDSFCIKHTVLMVSLRRDMYPRRLHWGVVHIWYVVGANLHLFLRLLYIPRGEGGRGSLFLFHLFLFQPSFVSYLSSIRRFPGFLARWVFVVDVTRGH